MRFRPDGGELPGDLIFLVCLALAWFVPRFGDRFFRGVEEFGSRLARRKTLAIFSIAAAVVVVRIAFLWLVPAPVPRIEDEFSYLLGGDTFAHGRLTNPTHPLSVFFDTIHVNQRPTYMSKYPPAQGMALALGELVGHPWIGVLLSMAAMCGLIIWMLQGWFPPRWALLGGVMVVLRVGLFSYWMNSYWGGAVAALGGAMVTGALPRIVRFSRPRDAMILSSGALILANSRPFEGSILCLPVLAVLLFQFSRKPLYPSIRNFVLPAGIVAAAGLAFMAFYNSRATGSPIVMAYNINERDYLAGTPLFFWRPARIRLHFANPQLEQFYNGTVREMWLQNRVYDLRSGLHRIKEVVMTPVRLWLWPVLLVPLLALPWRFGNKRLQFLAIQTAMVLAALLPVVWLEPQYLAPVTAAVFALVVLGIRRLRLWRVNGRPVGIAISRAVVVFAALSAPFGPGGLPPGYWQPGGIEYRNRFLSQLDQLPGKHLVIVHYAPGHDVRQHEWVYNGADIDGSKVAWAREIPGISLQPLLDYFRDRQIWVAEPDSLPPRMHLLAPTGPSSGP